MTTGTTTDMTTDMTSDTTRRHPRSRAPTPDLAPAPLPGAAANLPRDRPLRAAFLVVDGVYNSELMAPYDVLQHTAFHARPGIQVFTVSPSGQPVTTFEGIRITPGYSFQNAPPIDILVVPSTRGSMDRDLKDTALINWVRQVGGRARHVVSLCDGAFVLAQAGILDGVPATTFPDDYKRLAQMPSRGSTCASTSASSTPARSSPPRGARGATTSPCTWSTSSTAPRWRRGSARAC